jgi:hypothetical protein
MHGQKQPISMPSNPFVGLSQQRAHTWPLVQHLPFAVGSLTGVCLYNDPLAVCTVRTVVRHPGACVPVANHITMHAGTAQAHSLPAAREQRSGQEGGRVADVLCTPCSAYWTAPGCSPAVLTQGRAAQKGSGHFFRICGASRGSIYHFPWCIQSSHRRTFTRQRQITQR